MNSITLNEFPTYTYRRSHFLDWFAFLCPLVLFQEIELVGRLFLPELLLAIILPLLILKKGKLLLQPLPRTLIILGILWLTGQIITDLIRDTPFSDWSRGWAKITLLILNFSSIYLLLNNDVRRITLFTAGFAIGVILDYFISPTEYLVFDPWKFGLSLSVIFLVVLLLQWRKMVHFRLLSVLIIVALGLFSFYIGTRSIGALLIVSAIYLYIHQQPKLRRWLGKHLSLGRIIALIMVVSLSVWSLIALYGKAADSGWLGEEAQDKYRIQAGTSGGIGVLLGGRMEIIASSQAIMDSPIIGHGSWAKDQKYKLFLLSLYDMGYEINRHTILTGDSDLIPSHSHLFGAWVESGILGAFFWIWVFILIIRTLYQLFKVEHTLLPLLVTTLIIAIWDILFSPFGALGRLKFGFFLALFLAAHRFIQQYETNLRRNKTNR
jgi:hypothetical protein